MNLIDALRASGIHVVPYRYAEAPAFVHEMDAVRYAYDGWRLKRPTTIDVDFIDITNRETLLERACREVATFV